MKSSVLIVDSCGSPSRRRCSCVSARWNRPLLATITRSVTSRRTGFDGLRNDPQAQDPLAPAPFCQMISPRSSRPSRSWRMWITSAARLRYGLRPRLAMLTQIRPPGSSTRTQSAKTSCRSSRYSRYELGTPSRSSSSSYCLPAKYGGDVTTSATDPSRTVRMWRASPTTNGSSTGSIGNTVVSSSSCGGSKRP